MSIEVKTDDILVIIGKRGSGKSIFFKHIMKPIRRRIIWDYKHEHGDMGYIIHYCNQIIEEWKRGMVHIVFQPYSKRPHDFDHFLEVCWKLYNFTLAIEEIDQYMTPHFIPATLAKFIDVGRLKAIGIVGVARRPHKLHADLTSNADHIFCFRVHRPQDIGYLKEWIGEEAEQLKTIPKYYFLHYDDRKAETFLREKVSF